MHCPFRSVAPDRTGKRRLSALPEPPQTILIAAFPGAQAGFRGALLQAAVAGGLCNAGRGSGRGMMVHRIPTTAQRWWEVRR